MQHHIDVIIFIVSAQKIRIGFYVITGLLRDGVAILTALIKRHVCREKPQQALDIEPEKTKATPKQAQKRQK